MVQKQKEKVAKDALMAIVSKWFDRAALDKINVHSEDDYAGDPALFVNVRLKSSKDRLPPTRLAGMWTTSARFFGNFKRRGNGPTTTENRIRTLSRLFAGAAAHASNR
jgi:hypothetical protein